MPRATLPAGARWLPLWHNTSDEEPLSRTGACIACNAIMDPEQRFSGKQQSWLGPLGALNSHSFQPRRKFCGAASASLTTVCLASFAVHGRIPLLGSHMAASNYPVHSSHTSPGHTQAKCVLQNTQGGNFMGQVSRRARPTGDAHHRSHMIQAK